MVIANPLHPSQTIEEKLKAVDDKRLETELAVATTEVYEFMQARVAVRAMYAPSATHDHELCVWPWCAPLAGGNCHGEEAHDRAVGAAEGRAVP